jgi:2-polyprenyl-3-methyl-5-hydroxy-6-metoxy-1,4-benzoquinol methylase
MPFSQSSQISTIVGFIERMNPASVLDVGTGMGQYGFLARNNLENVNLFKVEGAQASQRPRMEWRVRIDGIEAFPLYLTPVHEYVYDNVMIGDALAILPEIDSGSYELVIAVDILEHFTRPDGLTFLRELKRVAKRAVMVSTPKEFISQEVEANPYENHRSLWSAEDMAGEGYGEVLDNDMSWIAVYVQPTPPRDGQST